MFVRNRSKFSARLAKGYFARDLGVLNVGVEAVFHIGHDGSHTPVATPERRAGDPPDVREQVLWRGTSATAFATVDGPERAPFARSVKFRVGEREVALAVFGDRFWERRLGQWVQSAPERFERIPLSWERAFGGTVELPPHRTREGLPHPGGPLSFVLNPGGRGLCVEHPFEPLDGTALPNIEHPQQLITSPHDQPTPQGVAPCKQLFGLRITAEQRAVEAKPSLVEAAFASWAPLRMLHHAPGWLVFDEALTAGTPLELSGGGMETLRTEVPACPVRAQTRSGAHTASIEPRVRSVHLDGERRQLWVTWGLARRYHPQRSPSWIDVEAA